MPAGQHIRILMCSLDGAAFLPEQLQSIADQTHNNWSLWVSDDGSTDGTLEQFQGFAARFPDRDIRLIDGPRAGVAQNYLSLLAQTANDTNALIALADQDDIWLPDKLTRAAQALSSTNPARPAAYASAQWLARDAHAPRRLSRPVPKGPSFTNALVQNVLSGNSLVLNAAAHDLIARHLPATPVPFHDWWIYQLLTGAGGQAIYDPQPGLIYRQHGTNTLGGNLGARASLARLGMLFGRQYAGWVRANLAALDAHKSALIPENRALLDAFGTALDQPGPARLRAIMRYGIARQSRLQTWAIGAAALSGRL